AVPLAPREPTYFTRDSVFVPGPGALSIHDFPSAGNNRHCLQHPAPSHRAVRVAELVVLHRPRHRVLRRARLTISHRELEFRRSVRIAHLELRLGVSNLHFEPRPPLPASPAFRHPSPFG